MEASTLILLVEGEIDRNEAQEEKAGKVTPAWWNIALCTGSMCVCVCVCVSWRSWTFG